MKFAPQSRKPFTSLENISQIFPVDEFLPPFWQTVFVIALAMLRIVYVLFQVIRANPWHNPKRQSPLRKPDSEHFIKHSPKRRHRKSSRRRRFTRGKRCA
jgi:hypothetical protein